MKKTFTLDQRKKFLKKHGDFCMSYSTLQRGVEYFDLEKIGYAAYVKQGNTRFVLANPVCDKKDIPIMVKAMLKEHPKTSFWQVTKDVAQILHEKFGYSMNIFGTETGIYRKDVWKKKFEGENKEKKELEKKVAKLKKEKDKLWEKGKDNEKLRKKFWKIKTKYHKASKRLEEFEQESPETLFIADYLKGPKKEMIRRQYNLALDKKLIVQEVDPKKWENELLTQISQEWITTRMVSKSEMKFFTRPLDPEFDAEHDVRLFVAGKKGKIAGYLMLDPIYKGNKIIGYFADIIRTRKKAAEGTGYLLLVQAMAKIFAEGYEMFNLGLSPFHKLGPVHLSKNGKQVRVDNKVMYHNFKTLFRFGNFLYNAKEQAFHKERFRGHMYPVYTCTLKKVPLIEVVGAFVASGIHPVTQTRAAIKRRFTQKKKKRKRKH